MATNKRAEPPSSSDEDGANKKPRALASDGRRPDDWIFGPAIEKSEMCQLLRSFDWSKTSLGPLSSWPMCVKSALSMCVTSKFGILLWLGPEFICVYNDAFRAYCGNKHPSKLGSPGSIYWVEMWPVLAPMLESVHKTGESTWMVDHLLPSVRHGYVEETYWTYSYSPILSPEGKVEGVFTATHETTSRVLSERRLTTLREVSASLSHMESVAQVCRVTAQRMERNRYDVPFLALYVMNAKDKILRCESSVGSSSGAWPAEVSTENCAEHLLVCMMQRKELTVCDLDEGQRKNFGALPPWSDTPHQVAFFPLRTHEASDEGSQGVLVMGLNTRRALDDDYRTFLALLGTQVASSLFNARAAEDEKSRAVELAELDRAKTTFFHNISHEFRTPLTLMLGPLEELLYNPSFNNLTEAQRVSLSLVHRNSTRLLKLVNMLLDFSRIEAGRMQATFRPVELPQRTAELASLFRAACERAQIRLIVNCPNEALRGQSVFVDVDLWEKIVLNLLSNAFKYTLKGEIEVRIEHDAAADMARLIVRDTGCGIPANELPRLFERFNRVQSSFGRTHEGTGIGLAFVHELVQLHGGRIQVSSAVGEGSTFSVYIPYGSAHLPSDSIASVLSGPVSNRPANAWWLNTINPQLTSARSSTSSVISAPSSSSSTPASAATMHHADILMGDLLLSDTGSLRRASNVGWAPARILVADDNEDMLAYLCRILAASGLYEIIEAHDGQEALDRMLNVQPKPELVLSDIMMPRLDGYGLLKAIRAHPDISQIPVIFLSARAGEEARTQGMSAGADDYLAKPFSAKELLARVAARIELYRLYREATRREEKLRRNAEEANNVKDRFLAVLSHELRTPLTPALLLAEEYLLDRSCSPAIAEDMAIISRQIRLQVQLIDDLLDVTKIRQGKLRLNLKPVDAHRGLRHTVAMFDRQLMEKHLRIDVQLQAECCITPGDSTRLQQIYWNLLGNAIKFSRLDGRILVRTWNDEGTTPPLLCIEVKDEGIGIEASALPKLFTAFEQTSQDVTRSFGGLGLGLVISKTLAVLHGGSLQASSAGKNKGAIFTLTLPTTIASPSVPTLALPSETARAPSLTTRPALHLRLLLVEDNAVSTQVMERLLRRLGHEVRSAPSCEQALKAATEHDAMYDVLLSDIGLPDGSGTDLVRQLRPLQPKMRAIALSGYGREEDVKRCYEAGFLMHLTKPVRLAQLADAITEVMAADLR